MYQPKVYKKDGGNTLVVASGGKIEVESGGTITLSDGSLEAADVALANGSILVGNANGQAAGVAMTGDVTITNAGVTAIGSGKVTSGMLANGSGLASLLAAGGGASAAYAKTTVGAQTLLAANGNGEGARSVLMVVTIDETFAAGDGTATDFDIGETDAATKFKEELISGTAGDVLTFAGSLTEEKALIVTGTAATGTGAGGISVTVLALPA